MELGLSPKSGSKSGRAHYWPAFAATALFLLATGFVLLPDILKPRDEKELAYALHMAGGAAVLVTGPFQFIASIRNRFRRYHRIAGYVFAGGTALSVLGFVLLQPVEPDFFLLSQATAITLWAASCTAAIVAIRKRHVLTHQHNMARAFVLASYFVTVRYIDRYLMWTLEPFSSEMGARLTHSDWLAWVIPLLLVEIWFGAKWNRAVYRPTRSTSAS